MRVLLWHLLILALTCSSLVALTNSANHYCVNRHTLRLEMDDFHHRDETIIPWLPDETEHGRLLESKRCRWNVKLKSPKPSQQQVVFEGVPSSAGMDSSVSANQTEIPLEILGINAHASQAVGFGTWRVIALNKIEFFSVRANYNPRRQKMQLKKLRIAMPLPRVCSRGMLNYNGSCYALSAVRQNLTDAMSSIRGDAQLASFSSMSEISEFIAANNAKLNEFPYRRPLSLGQPVRLGMFLNSTDAKVLSLVRTDTGCQLLPVADFDEFRVTRRVTGPCLSLRVTASSRAVIEFGNCSSPMLSLLSFPETASSLLCFEHCNISDTVTNEPIQFEMSTPQYASEYAMNALNWSTSANDTVAYFDGDFRYLIFILMGVSCISMTLWLLSKLCQSAANQSDYLSIVTA